MKVRFGCLSIVVAVVCLVALPAFSQETIRVGFVADMGGIAASFYKSQKQGIDLFIEETNAAGGILGKKIELIERDSQLKPDVGANVARELILSEKCEFLIGPTSSAVALAATKVAKEYKKIICFHTSNTEDLTTKDYQPYMIQVVPNTGMEARGCAAFLSQKPFKKYGYIGLDYAYGHTQWESFKEELSRLKPDVEYVEIVWVKQGETNYSSFIPTLMGKNPEAIFSSLWGGALSSFIKQAKPYGLFKKSTLTSLFDLDTLRATGKDMPAGLQGYTRCPFYGVNNPTMEAFVKKYHEKYNEWPADWAIMAYDALVALTEGIKQANSTDSTEIVKKLGGMKFKSLRGERYIRAEDHMANVGIYAGITEKDPKYDFLILKDVVEIPAEKIWLPADKVKALQPKD
jgi:branched-chain amino acid transport system substrate-binding protein